MKNLYLILGVWLLCASMYAQVTLNISNKSMNLDNTKSVTVEIGVNGFTNISSLQYSINWDPNVLKYSAITDITGQIKIDTDINFGVPGSGPVVKDGQMTFSWNDPQRAVTLNDGTVLYRIRFDYVGTSCKDTKIQLSEIPRIIEVIDAQGNEVNMTSPGGTVSFSGSSCTGTGGGDTTVVTNDPNAVGMRLGSATIKRGDIQCLPITVENWDSIEGIQVSVRWDSTLFLMSSYTFVPSYQASNIDFFPGNTRSAFTFTMSEAAKGLPNLSNGAKLVDLCLTAIGESGSSSVIEFNQKRGLGQTAIARVKGASKGLNLYSGKLTIGEGGTISNATEMYIENQTVKKAANQCIPIKVREFKNIDVVNIPINWDPTILQYESISSNSMDISSSDINTTQTSTGKLYFIANTKTPTTGTTLTNGQTMASVCFNAIGKNGASTPISFDDIGNLVVQVVDKDSKTLTHKTTKGSISIESIVNPGALTVTIPTISAKENEKICVPITVKNFTNVQSMLFIFEWDSTILDFKGFDATNAFNIELREGTHYNQKTGSTLNFVPPSTATSIYTFPDNTTLFKLCFDVLAKCSEGKSSILKFKNDGEFQKNEFIDNNSNSIESNFIDGKVDVNCSTSGGTLKIASSEVVPECGSNKGSVALTLTGGEGNISCVWKDASGKEVAKTCNVSNLKEGTYTTTIKDSKVTIDQNFTIQKYDLFSIAKTVQNKDCDVPGSITLNVTGGASPYNYTWNTGSTDASIANLGADNYSVVIKDNNGCKASENFVIEDKSGKTGVNKNNFKLDCSDSSNIKLNLNLDSKYAPFDITTSRGNLSGTSIQGLQYGNAINIVIKNNGGCTETITNFAINAAACGKSSDECSEATAVITPNGDGYNDQLVIACLGKAENQSNKLTIYDRWGRIKYEQSNYTNDWEGVDKAGKILREGGYFWVVQVNRSTGQVDYFRGTVAVLSGNNN